MEILEQKASNEAGKDEKMARFLKRTFFIFVLLFVISAGFNAVPLSIREVNNVIFSLFVHDDRVSLNGTEPTADIPTDRTGEYTEPIRIVSTRVGLDAKILNPESRDGKVLDDALLYGAVRYPGSGDLESTQNIFIFGHSSFLPVVHNQNYKAFNGLRSMVKGDTIVLYGNKRSYTYVVEKVVHTTADLAYINVASRDHELILSTCDSFGAKEERYIVTARYKSTQAL